MGKRKPGFYAFDHSMFTIMFICYLHTRDLGLLESNYPFNIYLLSVYYMQLLYSLLLYGNPETHGIWYFAELKKSIGKPKREYEICRKLRNGVLSSVHLISPLSYNKDSLKWTFSIENQVCLTNPTSVLCSLFLSK